MNPQTDADAGVLVAEDNPANRFVICAMLKSLGIKPLIAADGQAAVEMARSHPLRMILMDINMPKLNGMDAARQIRAHGPNRSVPIIAVTANVTERQRQDCEAVGFDGFIPKPVDVAVFRAEASRFLGDVVPTAALAAR